MNGLELIEKLAREERERVRKAAEDAGISPPSKKRKKNRPSFKDKMRKRGYTF